MKLSPLEPVVRALIRPYPPWGCAQKMLPGDARRWAHKGKAFSYVVCCPGCRKPIMVLADDWGLEESGVTTSCAPVGEPSRTNPTPAVRDFEHPTSMRSTKSVKCHGCGGTLSATGSELVLERPKPRG